MESLVAIIGNKKSGEECGLGWNETFAPEGIQMAMGQRGDPLARKLSAQLGIPCLKRGRVRGRMSESSLAENLAKFRWIRVGGE